MDILDSNHSIIANHNGESYFYKPCLQFDAFGLPRQFQDCAYILKYFLLLVYNSLVLKSLQLFSPMQFL